MSFLPYGVDLVREDALWSRNSKRFEKARLAASTSLSGFHEEHNHQGKQNRLLFPLPNRGASGDNGIVRCKERLGGLLKYYEREAA
jgi:hypothetical protein